jgi:hypothetical protein
MKILLLLYSLLFVTGAFGQVGIGTTNPQDTLDVDGTSRFRTTNQPTISTIKIGGLDADGVFREIYIGANLNLENNILSSNSNPKYTFGEITLDDNIDNEPDNVDLLIGSGELNEGKNIIRVNVTDSDGNLKFTGIQAGTDGQHIWLYPQHGDLELEENDADSLAQNQIEDNDDRKANRYEMIELVYDGTRNK